MLYNIWIINCLICTNKCIHVKYWNETPTNNMFERFDDDISCKYRVHELWMKSERTNDICSYNAGKQKI